MYVVTPLGVASDTDLLKLVLCVTYQMCGEFSCIYWCDRLIGSGASEVLRVYWNNLTDNFLEVLDQECIYVAGMSSNMTFFFSLDFT